MTNNGGKDREKRKNRSAQLTIGSRRQEATRRDSAAEIGSRRYRVRGNAQEKPRIVRVFRGPSTGSRRFVTPYTGTSFPRSLPREPSRLPCNFHADCVIEEKKRIRRLKLQTRGKKAACPSQINFRNDGITERIQKHGTLSTRHPETDADVDVCMVTCPAFPRSRKKSSRRGGRHRGSNTSRRSISSPCLRKLG